MTKLMFYDSNRDLAFGRAVNLFRNSRGLSSQGLSDLTDIDILRLRRIEKGVSSVKVGEIVRLARALDVSTIELITIAQGIYERWEALPEPTLLRPIP